MSFELRRRKRKDEVDFSDNEDIKVFNKYNNRSILVIFNGISLILHSKSIQLILILLILIDLLFLFYKGYLNVQIQLIISEELLNAFTPKVNRSLAVKVLKNIKHENGNFKANFIFIELLHKIIFLITTFEVILSIICFRSKFFNHFGYCTDFALSILGILGHSNFYFTRQINYLNLFRLWRVLRFLNSIVQEMEVKVNKYELTIEDRENNLKRLENKIELLEYRVSKKKEDESIFKEKYIKQKEQIQNLEEALKIAANSFVTQEQKLPINQRTDLFSSLQSNSINKGSDVIDLKVNPSYSLLEEEFEDDDDFFYDITQKP